MRHISTLLGSIFLAASLAATTAHSANSVNITSSTCTGTELRNLTGDAIFTCSGDYSFLSGSIEWDTKISITANGNLYFDDFTIKSNYVELSSLNGSLAITDLARFQPHSLTINLGHRGTPPGPIRVQPYPIGGIPGGVLIGGVGVITVVPEPETHAMLLAGLGLIGGIALRRKHKGRTAQTV